MLDDLDRRLLRQMQSDPALSVPELAELCGVSVGRASRRLERLREEQIIKGQEAVIDWQALGFAVRVSLRVTLDKTAPRAFDDFLSAAREVPEVIELQTFLGQVDVRLHLVAKDLPHYQSIYRQRILTLPHIADNEALMTVSTVKMDMDLPL